MDLRPAFRWLGFAVLLALQRLADLWLVAVHGRAVDQPDPTLRLYLFHGPDEAQSRALGARRLQRPLASRRQGPKGVEQVVGIHQSPGSEEYLGQPRQSVFGSALSPLEPTKKKATLWWPFLFPAS